MQIYNDKRQRVGTLTGFKDRTITKTLDSGDKELSFEYPADGKMAGLLKEENYIRTKEDEFVLKAVEAGEQYNKYTAVLNVEELEGQSYPYGFASHEQTIRACLEFAFEGTGWTVGACTVTKKRTIDIEEAATAWDVLQSCLSTYRCECEIDTLKKQVNIYTQIGWDRGCYFMEGLNLRKLTATSDTYEFYTRIIPIGKDGITIEWLGKEYLENYQYSSKVKTYTWKDERYTNTTSLIEDAEAKLEEMSKPYKVYAADVVDLANANPTYKNILDYGIGDTVMMVSKHPKLREKQRIVKIVEYPETPEKNTVELSNTTKTFAEVQKAETELAKTEAISIANSTTKKILQNYATTEEIETKITASKEAIELGVKHTLESYYDKTETDALIELTKGEIEIGVMHSFENYYDKTETDALIKLSKGEIELGVSEVYQTKADMSNYSTTNEIKALIDITAEGITSEVSKKVDLEEFGTLVTQNAYVVQIAWNKNSNYMQFEETGITLYNGQITDSQKRTSFKYSGIEFHLDGYHVGNIGTNVWSGTNKHGLVFDLNQGTYTTWSRKEGNLYITKWLYAAETFDGMTENTLNAGADIDMHNHKIKNVSWEGGGITGTIKFVQILKVNSDGTIANWANNGKMTFKNGILIGMDYYVD